MQNGTKGEIKGITIKETRTEGKGVCFKMTVPNGVYRFGTH
jgi:hypothetical protein